VREPTAKRVAVRNVRQRFMIRDTAS